MKTIKKVFAIFILTNMMACGIESTVNNESKDSVKCDSVKVKPIDTANISIKEIVMPHDSIKNN